MIIEPAILAERARLFREKKMADHELWIAHRERVRIRQAYTILLILILSLTLWGGIWLAVAAVSAWILPWL